MEQARRLVLTIEHLISTKTKQHIVGGLLFSAAVFLGALATTVLTTKIEAVKDTNQNEEIDDNLDDETVEYEEYDY
jgi:hypothetical protein